MFDIGFDELVLIMVVALLVYGPDKLPDLARALGRGYAEFRRAMNDLKETFDQDETVREIKQEFQKAQHEVLYGRPPSENTAIKPPPVETSGEPAKPPEAALDDSSVKDMHGEPVTEGAGAAEGPKQS
jgi:sec-independent protein translocase protein TatB